MLEKFRSYFKNRPKVSPEHDDRIAQLERIINVNIDDPFLYIRALQHRSILADDSFNASDSYERLEFLGDAVLDLIVTEIIFDEFPEDNEGFLTKLRAKLVKGDALAEYARQLKLSDLLVLGERAQGQGIEFSRSVLADVFEALIAAVYLDKGYKQAAHFVESIIHKYVDIESVIDTLDNYKSQLLEYAQAHKFSIPRYEVFDESGPGHDKTFEVRVIVDEKDMGHGRGKSKKEAEQRAARAAMKAFLKGKPEEGD